MPRHMPPDFGEIGCAGAGFVDELTVKHYDQTIRQFQQFVEILADQQHRGAAITRCRDQAIKVVPSETSAIPSTGLRQSKGKFIANVER